MHEPTENTKMYEQPVYASFPTNTEVAPDETFRLQEQPPQLAIDHSNHNNQNSDLRYNISFLHTFFRLKNRPGWGPWWRWTYLLLLIPIIVCYYVPDNKLPKFGVWPNSPMDDVWTWKTQFIPFHHTDPVHLWGNVAGLLFFGFVCTQVTPTWLLLSSIPICSLFTAYGHAFSSQKPLEGASGLVFGLVPLIAYSSNTLSHTKNSNNRNDKTILILMLLNVLCIVSIVAGLFLIIHPILNSTSHDISNGAHVGGAFGGFICILLHLLVQHTSQFYENFRFAVQDDVADEENIQFRYRPDEPIRHVPCLDSDKLCQVDTAESDVQNQHDYYPNV